VDPLGPFNVTDPPSLQALFYQMDRFTLTYSYLNNNTGVLGTVLFQWTIEVRDFLFFFFYFLLFKYTIFNSAKEARG
jgi:hypothetical protein